MDKINELPARTIEDLALSEVQLLDCCIQLKDENIELKRRLKLAQTYIHKSYMDGTRILFHEVIAVGNKL